MNRPDAHILDEWIFDYLEGNLDPAGRRDFEELARNDATVRAELEAWQGTVVTAPLVNFPGKAAITQAPGALEWAGLLKKGGFLAGAGGKSLLILVISGVALAGWRWLAPVEPNPPQALNPSVVIQPEPEKPEEEKAVEAFPKSEKAPAESPTPRARVPFSKERVAAVKPDTLSAFVVRDSLAKDSLPERKFDLTTLPTRINPPLTETHEKLPRRIISIDSLLEKLKKPNSKVPKRLQAPALRDDAF